MQSNPCHWHHSFPLRSYEMNHHGRLSFFALCQILQEASSLHSKEIGIGNDLLLSQGFTWVLTQFHVRVEHLQAWPKKEEPAIVETWRADLEKIFSIRDFRVFSGENRPFAVATSSWTVFDIKTRKPCLPKVILEGFKKINDRALVSRHERFVLNQVDYEKTFEARMTDIDSNVHVNNITYMKWAVETLPMEFTKGALLKDLKIIFRAESVWGDQVLSRVYKESETTYLHEIIRLRDLREVCHARTIWALPESAAEPRLP